MRVGRGVSVWGRGGPHPTKHNTREVCLVGRRDLALARGVRTRAHSRRRGGKGRAPCFEPTRRTHGAAAWQRTRARAVRVRAARAGALEEEGPPRARDRLVCVTCILHGAKAFLERLGFAWTLSGVAYSMTRGRRGGATEGCGRGRLVKRGGGGGPRVETSAARRHPAHPCFQNCWNFVVPHDLLRIQHSVSRSQKQAIAIERAL